MMVDALGADELDVSECKDIATGTVIGGAVLLKVVMGSILETPEGSLLTDRAASTVWRNCSAFRGG